MACSAPVLRSEAFHEGITEVRRVRDILAEGKGRLIDKEGLDWWELTYLLIAPDILTLLAFRRMASQIPSSAELWATRAGGPAELLSVLLGRSLGAFTSKTMGGRIARYAQLARRFSAGQIREIFFDKYDPGYRWRGRFTRRPPPLESPVVLLPSAYENVSRLAAVYAGLLPQQSFLMIVTRRSGRQFVKPPNVQMRELAAYSGGAPSPDETASLLDRWSRLQKEFAGVPELGALVRAGRLAAIPNWIRDGLRVRNAWRSILENEPVCGVLCGDDSNRYTVLPVLLAARRKIPTVDFHHGAFDGRFLLKDVPCDSYLAKSEMERDYLLRVCGLPEQRVMLGAPAPGPSRSMRRTESARGDAAIFFSEPYEVQGMRGREVYAEVLPRLCGVAREHGRRVIIKLHPFESRAQRQEIVDAVLSPEDRTIVSLVDGPLQEDLWSRAWFGVTVESTCVIDCLLNGIPCFLCDWLRLGPFEYARQYARFGVGERLRSAAEIGEIPLRLETYEARKEAQSALPVVANPASLRKCLTGGCVEQAVSDSAPQV